jgi:hypothetical protein
MTFHVDFWVAAATAASVIALSATVSTSATDRQLIRTATSPLPLADHRSAAIKLNLANWISFDNVGMQLIALLFSLLSLTQNSNAASPDIIIVLTVLGLFLIAVSTQLYRKAYRDIAVFELLQPEVAGGVGDDETRRLDAGHGQDTSKNDTEDES